MPNQKNQEEAPPSQLQEAINCLHESEEKDYEGFIEILIDKDSDRLINYATRKCGVSYHDAEDIVSICFAKACRGLETKQLTFRDEGQLRSYIYKCIADRCIDFFRKRSRESHNSGQSDGIDIESLISSGRDPRESAEENDTRGALERCISKLKCGLRDVIWKYYWGGMTQQEIAKSLDKEVDPSTISRRLNTATSQIKICLERTQSS
jgi:RNA polymerase sigma factor (sigma-70 family)